MPVVSSFNVQQFSSMLYVYVMYHVECLLLFLLYYLIVHKHTHTPVERPFFRDYLGGPVPER